MKKVISLLNDNYLKSLEKEFNKQLSEFKNKLELGKNYTTFFIREKKIRTEIQKLRSNLRESINSVKDKLKSRKKLLAFAEEVEKRNKEREVLLQKLLSDRT